MRFVHRILISAIDILILAFALTYIFLGVLPAENIGFFTFDALFIFLTVIILYVVIVGFVSLCLTYMREDNTIAKLVKGFVSTVLIVTLFNWVIFPLMWFLGYAVHTDVQWILTITAIVRLMIKIFLGRRLSGGTE